MTPTPPTTRPWPGWTCSPPASTPCRAAPRCGCSRNRHGRGAAFQHDARAIPRRRRALEGIHPRRRHHPGRARSASRPPRPPIRSTLFYRALRLHQPSPYLFCLELGGRTLVGSSPEVNVRCEDGEVNIRPIAGTRPRAADAAADRALGEELLGDPKERAEHVMLVDLACNDIGRVCEWGSVTVSEFMVVERYSHVMHIVSNVRGRLRSDRTAYDLLRATFPAGTLSGALKIRAMEIIAELEARAGLTAAR
ncbi:MAG: chorismate-binding protein [Kiritimatiellia bacterium]